MNKSTLYLVLFLICIVSRLITSINYVEDPQSMVISMYVIDAAVLPSFYNMNAPLFCLLVKGISELTHNFSLSFSILGGVSTFAILFFMLRLFRIPLASLEGGLIVFIIFFNPLLWIASNRYTPEMSAAAISIASFYYLMAEHEHPYATSIGWALAGLSIGFGFLFFPFLLLPLLYSLFYKKGRLIAMLLFLIGTLPWILPVLLAGEVETAFKSFCSLYFTYAPGEVSFNFVRLADLVKNVWAGGLGGYWWMRSPLTLVISIAALPCLFLGTTILLSFDHPRKKMFTFFMTTVLFMLWLYFCPASNMISVVLIIPFLCAAIAYGIIYFLVNFNLISVKAAVLTYLVCLIWLSIYMALEHNTSNASEQLKNYMTQNRKHTAALVCSTDLYQFLSLKGVHADHHVVSPATLGNDVIALDRLMAPEYAVRMPLSKKTRHFSHNPFINSQWSALTLYEY